MNVLQVSLAELIAKGNLDKPNDPQIHQIKYGKRIFTRSFIVVKTPRDKNFKQFHLLDNVSVYPTRSRNRYVFLWDAWRIARKIARENKIDLVITQDPFITGLVGYLVKKEFSIPINVHDVCDFIDNPHWIREWWGNRILNPLGKFILGKADSIRVDSQQEVDKLKKLGMNSNKIWNIPFILNDAGQFINSRPILEFRRALLKDKFDRIVLFVGRFVEQKDLPTLFGSVQRVVQRRPQTLFVIVGDGKRNQDIHKIVDRMGISENMLFAGWVDYFDLPKYYAVCDAFILTSRYETSPRVIIFACLTRKPVVATDVSGVRDFIEEGKNGFVVSVGDEKGLANGMIDILENPERSKAMGTYGFEKAQSLLDEEKILRTYQQMFETTLDTRRRPK